MVASTVATYEPKRSAPIPATSPTLSPTLSAMVAGLRGSSSGMPASTLPTRSAPTSAALVKMPPPTRRKRASREPPDPQPAGNRAGAPAGGEAPGGACRHGAVAGRGGGAHVAPHGQAHPDEAGEAR